MTGFCFYMAPHVILEVPHVWQKLSLCLFQQQCCFLCVALWTLGSSSTREVDCSVFAVFTSQFSPDHLAGLFCAVTTTGQTLHLWACGKQTFLGLWVDVGKLQHARTNPRTRNRLSMSGLFCFICDSFSTSRKVEGFMVRFRFLLLSNLPTPHVRPRRRRNRVVGG